MVSTETERRKVLPVTETEVGKPEASKGDYQVMTPPVDRNFAAGKMAAQTSALVLFLVLLIVYFLTISLLGPSRWISPNTIALPLPSVLGRLRSSKASSVFRQQNMRQDRPIPGSLADVAERHRRYVSSLPNAPQDGD